MLNSDTKNLTKGCSYSWFNGFLTAKFYEANDEVFWCMIFVILATGDRLTCIAYELWGVGG